MRSLIKLSRKISHRTQSSIKLQTKMKNSTIYESLRRQARLRKMQKEAEMLEYSLYCLFIFLMAGSLLVISWVIIKLIY